jgi:hypothetical protein
MGFWGTVGSPHYIQKPLSFINYQLKIFSAYFQILKKYATVRTLSVRLSVRQSVCLSGYYFLGGWMILLVYGSIDSSIEPQGMNQERNFF